MTTVSQVTNPPLSGIDYIDALIGSGQPWNFIGRDTINFSFAVDAGGDPSGTIMEAGTLTAFTPAQEAQMRTILAYASQLTGILFAEVGSAAQADLHLADARLLGGFTSQNASLMNYTAAGDQVTSLEVDAWVYLDSINTAENASPTPGTYAYESLLHELGHVLGLKHPFEGTPQLPAGNGPGQDNTGTTLMSWNELGAPRSTYSPYDLAALQWLYGGDGLGGLYGVGAPGQSIVGTAGPDTLRGADGPDLLNGVSGNDRLEGGAGTDTAVIESALGGLLSVSLAPGQLSITTASGTATLVDIERVRFSDALFAFDTQAPATGAAGGHVWQAAALLQAVFGTLPGRAQLSQWTAEADRLDRMGELGQQMISQYAPGVSNTDLVRFLYQRLVHTVPADATVQAVADQIGAGKAFATPGDLLAAAASLSFNTDQMVGFAGSVQPLDLAWF